MCCQFINLVEIRDVPLKQMEAAGLDVREQGGRLLIGCVSLKSEDEQLSDFLFQGKPMCIPHWILCCALSRLHSHPLIGFIAARCSSDHSAFFLSSDSSRRASSGVMLSTSMTRRALRSSSSRAVKSDI